MAQANVDTDPFFQLLTDALRAGPGSPEWHQAVAKLREDGAEHGDEYRLLITAREHLESGKDYRSVRAGPGFTRKLLDNIEKGGVGAGVGPRRLPTATLVAVMSGLAIVAVLAVVGWRLWPRGGGGGPPHDPVAELAKAFDPQSSLPAEVVSGRFDGTMPAGWVTVGQMTLEAGKSGLRPVLSTGPAAGAGGAVLVPGTLPPDQPFVAEVKLGLNKPGDDVILEVFVSVDPKFSDDRATSGNELVWLLRGNKQEVVLVSGDAPRPVATKPAPARGDKDPKSGGQREPVTVRLLVDKEVAIAEANGQRLWAGPHGLSTTPRQVGVRFLRAAGGGKGQDPASVESIRVLKK